MSSSYTLQEHWTDQKSAVVVTAEPAIIGQLLVDLNLPEESPVSVSENRLALAFWGEDLSAYISWRNAAPVCLNGNGARSGANGDH